MDGWKGGRQQTIICTFQNSQKNKEFFWFKYRIEILGKKKKNEGKKITIDNSCQRKSYFNGKGKGYY